MRRRLTYANVTATLALFFALSGGALAASHYLVNSTKQINPRVLRALRGHDGASGASGAMGAQGKEGPRGAEGPAGERGAEGKEGLTGKEGKEGREGLKGERGEPGAAAVEGKEGKPGKEGPPGPEGKEGKEGKPGKEGPPAKLSAITEYLAQPETTVKPEETGVSEANCPEGSRVISGGFSIEGEKMTTPAPSSEESEALPERKGWVIRIRNPSATESIFLEAFAYCAEEGSGVAAARIGPAARGPLRQAGRRARAARAR
jgi:hypothetical protein